MLNSINIIDRNIYNLFYNSGDMKTQNIMRGLTAFGEPIIATIIGIILIVAIYFHVKRKVKEETSLKVKDIFGNYVPVEDETEDNIFLENEEEVIEKNLIRKNIIFVLSTIGITQITTYIMKNIIRRARPEENILKNGIGGFSFPSGHTTIISTYSAILSYYISNSKMNVLLKATIIVLLFLFSVFVGLSRMYLGAHYMFDVIFGLIIGWGIPLITMNVFDKRKRD